MQSTIRQARKYFRFPTGEAHCRLDGSDDLLFVPMMENLNDYLMTVLLACETNERVRDGKPFDLLLPYLPYSRQDRPTSRNEPFSLKVVGKLLNAAPCRHIYTLDVHSDVSYACVDRLINIPPEQVWHDLLLKNADNTLVIPDMGAYKKLSKLTNKFKNHVIGLKQRDIATGHLKIADIVGDVKEQHCVIFDDICDGGGTFVLLAKELYQRGASAVELAVIHGVFTKGKDVLFEAGIKNIYTTNSFPHEEQPKVHVTDVLDIYRRHSKA